MPVESFSYNGETYQLNIPKGENPQKYFDSFVQQLNREIPPEPPEPTRTEASPELSQDYQRYMFMRNNFIPQLPGSKQGMEHTAPSTEGPIPEHLQGTSNPLIHAGRELSPLVEGPRRAVSSLKEFFNPVTTRKQREADELPDWYLSEEEYQQKAREAKEFDKRRHPFSAQLAGSAMIGLPLGMSSYVPRLMGLTASKTFGQVPKLASFGEKIQRKADRIADAMIENRIPSVPLISSGVSGAGYGANEYVDPDLSPLDRTTRRLQNTLTGFTGGVVGDSIFRPIVGTKRIIDAERFKKEISGDLEEVVDIPASKLYGNKPHLQTTEAMARSTEPGTIEARAMTATRARADRQIERNARAINEELTGNSEFKPRGVHLVDSIQELRRQFRSSKGNMSQKYTDARRAGDVRAHNRYLGNLQRSMENYIEQHQIKVRGKPKKIIQLVKSLRDIDKPTFSAHKLPILYQDINRELYNAKGGDKAHLTEFKKYVENTMKAIRDDSGFQGPPEAIAKFLDATDYAANHYDTFVNNRLMRNTVIGEKFGKGNKYTPEEVSTKLLGASNILESGGVFTSEQSEFLEKWLKTVPQSKDGISKEFLNKLLSGHKSANFSQDVFMNQYSKSLQGGKAPLFMLFPEPIRKKLEDLDRVVEINSQSRDTAKDTASMGPLVSMLTDPAPIKRLSAKIPIIGMPFDAMRKAQIKRGLIYREGLGIKGSSVPGYGTYIPSAATALQLQADEELDEDIKRNLEEYNEWRRSLGR